MASYKKIPLRKCVVSQQILPKKDLVRIVKTLNGKIIFDQSGKINGRGFYLQPTLEIYKKSKKSNILERVLKTKLTDQFYKMLYCKIIESLNYQNG